MTAVALIMPSEAYRIDDFMSAAARLGLEVVVVTDAHHGLAEDMGASLIPVDFSDEPDAARRLAGSSAGFAAVLPIDDRGVRIAAKAAQLRGTPHNPLEASFLARDKAAARRHLEGVVPQPAFHVLADGTAARSAVAELGLPIVLKPVGLAGSLGVVRVDDPDVLDGELDRVRSIQAQHGYPPSHPILAERYVAGAEVSVEGLLHRGSWRTLAVFDKPDIGDGPYFPERYFITPSRHDNLAEIEQLAAAAATALGLVDGPVHAEFRLTPEPVLLELAARSIGGLCGRALRFGLTETSLEELILRNALGEEVRGTSRAPGASGVAMLGVERPGRFGGLAGTEDALSHPHVTEIEESARRGQDVVPLPEESTYLGFVFARAPEPGDVESALRAAVDRLDVLIE